MNLNDKWGNLNDVPEDINDYQIRDNVSKVVDDGYDAARNKTLADNADEIYTIRLKNRLEYFNPNNVLYTQEQLDELLHKQTSEISGLLSKMYTEEEVKELIVELSCELYDIYPFESLIDWFNKNKKK